MPSSPKPKPKPKPPTTLQRLAARLRTELPAAGFEPPPEGFTAVRMYTGRSDLNNGAWTWQLLGADGTPLDVGSQWPARDLVRFHRWIISRNEYGEVEVDPDLPDLRAAGVSSIPPAGA